MAGSPWENGYIESFNGKLRDELLNGEIFDTLEEARVIIGQWRHEYNTIRPHSALGYKPPVPEAKEPLSFMQKKVDFPLNMWYNKWGQVMLTTGFSGIFF